MLCRNCVKFVDKMDQFIRRAQSLDNTPSDLNSEYSVKRCVQLSPSPVRMSRRSESHQVDLQNSFPSQLLQPRQLQEIIPRVQPLMRSNPNELHHILQRSCLCQLRKVLLLCYLDQQEVGLLLQARLQISCWHKRHQIQQSSQLSRLCQLQLQL